MLTLEELKTYLQPNLSIDVEQAYEVFQSETGQHKTDAFVRYLYEQQIIGVTDLDQLVRYDIELAGLTTILYEDTAPPIAADSPGAIAPIQKAARNQYHLLVLLGQGAMGSVHLAKDAYLQRKVAYKQLLSNMVASPVVLGRFLQEVQITAQLDHPNIVPVYTLDITADNSLAYTMKVVQGKTFKELIQETKERLDNHQPLDEEHSPTTLLNHFLKACDAVDYAHNKGVIHRDLKPANIMVGRFQEVYVMDWGIARIMGDLPPLDLEVVEVSPLDENIPESERSEAGKVVGTPRYMSPQQAAGKNEQLDGRSDQFAMGLILYELVTLKAAFTAKSQMDLLKRVLKAELDPFVHYQPGTPIAPELQAIILKATRRKVEGRYPSVQALAEDVRRYLRGEAVLAKQDTPWQRVMRWAQRHPEKILAAGMVILTLSASALITSMYVRQQATLAAQAREQRLGAFLTTVTQQSQKINIRLLKAQSQLQGLAGAATQVLSRGAPAPGKYYTDHPFQAPDQRYSKHYGNPISLGYSNFTIGEGLTEAEVATPIRQLNQLSFYLRRMLIDSYTDGDTLLSKQEADRLIREQGVPLMFASAVSKQGVIIFYPGIGYNTPGYDPRERPFYKLVENKRGLRCGNPYLDRLTGALLPCSVPLYDPEDNFIGAATFDMQFNYIIQNFMTLPITAVRKTYLLDEQGRIVLRSSDQREVKDTKKIHTGFELPPFPFAPMVKKIQAGESGYLFNRDQSTLYVFDRLNALGWYFVVEANAPALLASP